MPMEIASHVVFDPLLASRFDIIKRVDMRDENGRTVVAQTQQNNIVGVICMNDDIELLREEFPEVQYTTRVISVVSAKKLQTAAKGWQPDIVVWLGDNYLVRRVSPYPQFGRGFYEAVCSSIDLKDAPI